MTPERQRALERVQETMGCSYGMSCEENEDKATIEAALTAPQLTDEQWEQIQHDYEVAAELTLSDGPRLKSYLAIAAAIRASRGEQ